MSEAQVLFIHTARCSRCGALDTISELFAVDPLATGTGRHLFPATSFNEHLPLDRVALPPRIIPICRHCCDGVTITEQEARMRWEETLKRKREEARLAAEAAKRTANNAKKNTILDLL